MASMIFSFLRSLLPRRTGPVLPTMHSLRVHPAPQGGSPGALFDGAAKRPLRVVQSRGRLVISGRMADVCAELERLAALESGCAAQALAPAR